MKNKNHNTINHVLISPCILPRTKGNDAPKIAIGVLLKIQKTPIPIAIPNAESQNEYHTVSGIPKSASGVRKDNPIMFWLVEAKLLGFPDPYHLPIMSEVSWVKIVLPEAVAGTILEATTFIPNWSRLKK